ncbi:13793_t:CDS:1, partial [Gigaspora margarita]
HVIEAEPLSGSLTGKRVFLPRIMLTPTNALMPLVLKRRQFSCQLAFAMTIHKSQGQTINWLGLYVFSHRQLYVACSSVISPQRLRIFLGQANIPE